MAARRPFWKWRRWKSIDFCLWPPSTCIWNLKLKFQRKLDLCSGNHVVYRQTDRQTDGQGESSTSLSEGIIKVNYRPFSPRHRHPRAITRLSDTTWPPSKRGTKVISEIPVSSTQTGVDKTHSFVLQPCYDVLFSYQEVIMLVIRAYIGKFPCNFASHINAGQGSAGLVRIRKHAIHFGFPFILIPPKCRAI